MDLKDKILRSLKKHGELTSTQLHKIFHREDSYFRACVLNALYLQGLIDFDKKLTKGAKKSTTVWRLKK